MNYLEYVKEKWQEYITGLIYALPLFGMFGWVVPLLIGIMSLPFDRTIALYFGVSGIIWCGVIVIYWAVEAELNNYRDWKDNYRFNHSRHPKTNSDKQSSEDRKP